MIGSPNCNGLHMCTAIFEFDFEHWYDYQVSSASTATTMLFWHKSS